MRRKHFYTKMLKYFKRTLKLVERPQLWVHLLILLISAVTCKEREPHGNKVTQSFWKQKY